MDYKNIFSPETLANLNKKSADNLRTIMGDKDFRQVLMSSQHLVSQIAEIEVPYKQQLEKLAVDMVKELYPIIEEEGIIIDAKLSTEQEIGDTLNEIKVRRPGVRVPEGWEENILESNEVASWSAPMDGWDQEHFDVVTIIKTPDNNFRVETYISYGGNRNYEFKTEEEAYSKAVSVMSDIKDDWEDDSEYMNEVVTPEARRRIINAITQGASVRGTFAFYLFKEHLDELDPTLVQKYNQLMKEVFGIYDDPNAIALMLSMLAQGHKQAGGSSKVIINEIGTLKSPNDINIIKNQGYSNTKFKSINGDQVTTQVVDNPIYTFPALDIIYNTNLKKIIDDSLSTGEEEQYINDKTPNQFKNVASVGFNIEENGKYHYDRIEKQKLNNEFDRQNKDFLRNKKISADESIEKWVKSYKKNNGGWDIEFKNPEWNNPTGAIISLKKGIERWLTLTDGQNSPNYLEWKKKSK